MNETSSYRTSQRKEQIAHLICGRFVQIIEEYARSAEIPAAQLTARVAELLYPSEMREILGPENNVPDLLGEATPRRGRPPRPLEMAGGPYRAGASAPKRISHPHARTHDAAAFFKNGMRISQIARRMGVSDNTVRTYLTREGITPPGSAAGYKYPEGTHWTQRPENKARLRKMMRQKRAMRRK